MINLMSSKFRNKTERLFTIRMFANIRVFSYMSTKVFIQIVLLTVSLLTLSAFIGFLKS